MRNAILYARTASSNSANLDYQCKEMIEYSMNKGLNVLKEFQVTGEGGSNNQTWKELMQFIRLHEHNVDALIVTRWCRISRYSDELEKVFKQLDELGVEVHFSNEPILRKSSNTEFGFATPNPNLISRL